MHKRSMACLKIADFESVHNLVSQQKQCAKMNQDSDSRSHNLSIITSDRIRIAPSTNRTEIPRQKSSLNSKLRAVIGQTPTTQRNCEQNIDNHKRFISQIQNDKSQQKPSEYKPKLETFESLLSDNSNRSINIKINTKFRKRTAVSKPAFHDSTINIDSQCQESIITPQRPQQENTYAKNEVSQFESGIPLSSIFQHKNPNDKNASKIISIDQLQDENCFDNSNINTERATSRSRRRAKDAQRPNSKGSKFNPATFFKERYENVRQSPSSLMSSMLDLEDQSTQDVEAHLPKVKSSPEKKPATPITHTTRLIFKEGSNRTLLSPTKEKSIDPIKPVSTNNQSYFTQNGNSTNTPRQKICSLNIKTGGKIFPISESSEVDTPPTSAVPENVIISKNNPIIHNHNKHQSTNLIIPTSLDKNENSEIITTSRKQGGSSSIRAKLAKYLQVTVLNENNRNKVSSPTNSILTSVRDQTAPIYNFDEGSSTSRINVNNNNTQLSIKPNKPRRQILLNAEKFKRRLIPKKSEEHRAQQ